MLEFPDHPYRHFPPKRIAPIAWLLTLINPWFRLPRVKKIKAVEVSGHDAPRRIWSQGDRILFTPNRPTHADAEIFAEAIRQAGLTTQFMAAYEVFLRGRLHALAMQLLGTFSVDREGSDPKAMAQARSILAEGRHTLTIFPEGNVYLQNEQVTPFHEGAAMLALRAAKDLSGRSVRVWTVPVSIKATYTVDVRDEALTLLRRLGESLNAEWDEASSPLEKMRAVGRGALCRNLDHRGMKVPESDTLKELIRESADLVLMRLERKMKIERRPGEGLIDRVRRARRKIHQVRLDEKKFADHKAATVWADEAMVAFRIASYTGEYVASHPSLDRFAETVEKLAEDIYARELPPLGPRHAYVRFGEPVDLSEFLESFRKKAREATRALTERLERAVQDGLDALIDANPHPGGKLMISRPPSRESELVS